MNTEYKNYVYILLNQLRKYKDVYYKINGCKDKFTGIVGV